MHPATSIFSGLSALGMLSMPTTTSALATRPPNSVQKPLRVGVLYENVQLSDIVGLDLFGHQTPEIMALNIALNPALQPLMNLTTPMEFLYISSSLDVAWATPKMWIKPTHTYANAPRDLDVLVLGGPDYNTVADASLEFLRAHKDTKTIMTTCTGAVWLAKSGVLDGKNATTNRGVLAVAKELYPKVQWLDQRWVIDDGHVEGSQIWTAGGAGCGEFFLTFWLDCAVADE
jgi:hypothetical protein